MKVEHTKPAGYNVCVTKIDNKGEPSVFIDHIHGESLSHVLWRLDCQQHPITERNEAPGNPERVNSLQMDHGDPLNIIQHGCSIGDTNKHFEVIFTDGTGFLLYHNEAEPTGTGSRTKLLWYIEELKINRLVRDDVPSQNDADKEIERLKQEIRQLKAEARINSFNFELAMKMAQHSKRNGTCPFLSPLFM